MTRAGYDSRELRFPGSRPPYFASNGARDLRCAWTMTARFPPPVIRDQRYRRATMHATRDPRDICLPATTAQSSRQSVGNFLQPSAKKGPRFEPRRRHFASEVEDRPSRIVLSSALRRRLSPVVRAPGTSCCRRPKTVPGSSPGGATLLLELGIAFREYCSHLRCDGGSDL